MNNALEFFGVHDLNIPERRKLMKSETNVQVRERSDSLNRMANRKSTLRKVYRAAILSFENGVRLHEDAILLLTEGRDASALYMSALAIEEIGKYFLYEEDRTTDRRRSNP